jgi:thiamine-monophosphate kinase
VSQEFEIIEQVLRTRATTGSRVSLGIGDDAALTTLPDGCELVTATDALVAGTHFLPTDPPHSVGHRCLAVNLSDLAAMAAQPLWASLALSLPQADMKWLHDFADGFFSLAEEQSVALIGGDTVRGSLAAVVTLQGCVPAGQAVLRTGASAGDLIYVTGTPGDAVAGRLLAGELIAEPAALTPRNRELLVGRYWYPSPRVAWGIELRKLATAMIDISDGLHLDLGRLLSASGCGAQLNIEQLPLSRTLRDTFDAASAAEFALTGGDDYELCFTVAPGNADELEALAASQDLPIGCLGSVAADPGLGWSLVGKPYTVPASGFEHFA